MVLTFENFIQLYKALKNGGNRHIVEEQLQEYDISREQFLSYVDFIDDLELNEEGIRVMFKEVQSGSMKI